MTCHPKVQEKNAEIPTEGNEGFRAQWSTHVEISVIPGCRLTGTERFELDSVNMGDSLKAWAREATVPI